MLQLLRGFIALHADSQRLSRIRIFHRNIKGGIIFCKAVKAVSYNEFKFVIIPSIYNFMGV